MKAAKTKAGSAKPKFVATKPTIRFIGELSEAKSDAFLILPKSASAKIAANGVGGARGVIKVEGILNSFPFQSTVESDGKKGLALKLTQAMRNAAKLSKEKTVTIEITLVGAEIETRVPADLRKGLNAIPKAEAQWKAITSSARRDWIFWLISAKQEKTRMERIKKAQNMLSSGKKRVCCFGGVGWLGK